MNSVEAEDVNHNGIGSDQQNNTNQTKDVNEYREDTKVLPDATPAIQGAPVLQSILASDRRSITSEVTFIVKSESSTNCIPSNQNVWGETTSAAGDGRNVTFENSHVSVFKAADNFSSRDAFDPYCESSTTSKDAIWNVPEKVNSRASVNAFTKSNLINVSPDDHTSSTVETATTTVFRDVTTTTPCRNLENNEGNKDIAATPEFSSLPLIVQGYMGSVSTGSRRVSSMITSGEKIASPLFEGVFRSLSTTDTAGRAVDSSSSVNFVDTIDTQVTSSLGNGTPEEGEINVSLEELTDDICLASESGEKSPSKEASFPKPENTNILSERSPIPGTSTDMETFPPNCQLSLALVSESTTNLSSDDKTTDGAFGAADQEDKIDIDTFKQGNSSVSVITPTASIDMTCFFSNDNTSENTATTVSSEVSRSSVTGEENATNFANITAACLDSAATSDTIPVFLKNVSTISGNSPTNAVADLLPSGTLGETINPEEETTGDSENFHLPTHLINSFENTDILGHKAARSFGNGRDKEVMIASDLRSGHHNPDSVSPQRSKGSRISSGFHNAMLQEVLEDSPAVVSIRESPDNLICVGPETIAMEGHDHESSIVSEGADRITSAQKTIQRHKTSSDGLSSNVIPGNGDLASLDEGSIDTVSKEISEDGGKQNVDVPGYVTATASSQITTTYSAGTESKRPSEITTDKTTATLGNVFTTYEDTPNKSITISTNTDILEPTTEISIKNIEQTMDDHNIITSWEASSSSTEPTTDVTSEEIITITLSRDVIRPMESKEMTAVGLGDAVAIATTSASFESSTFKSFGDRDIILSTTEDTVDIISKNVPISDAGDLPPLGSKTTPIIHGKIIPDPGKDINNFMAQDSGITVTSRGTSGSNMTFPTSDSENFTNISDETMRIQATTNHDESEALEELITGVHRPALSADITSGILTFSREQLTFDSPSSCRDSCKEILTFDNSSGHDTTQNMNLKADTIINVNKTPSTVIAVVSKNVTGSLTTDITLFPEENSADGMEDAAVNMDNSLLSNTNNTGDTSTGTPEEIDYGDGITSVHTHYGTTTVLGHSSTPNSSSSVGTSTEEISIGPGGTTNIPEDRQLEDKYICLSEQKPNFSQTFNIRSSSSESTKHSGRTLEEDTSSGNSNNTNDTLLTPTTIEIKAITGCKDKDSVAPDSCMTDVLPTLEVSESSNASENVCSVITSRKTTCVATSVQSNTMSTTKIGQPTTNHPPRDDVKTTPATRTTTAVIALKEPVCPGDQPAHTLQDSQNLGEIITSENIVTTAFQKTEMYSGISMSETRTLPEIHILENASDPVVDDTPVDTPGHLVDEDSPAIADVVTPLRDTISASASSPSESRPRSEGFFTSKEIPTDTSCFQKQTAVTETPASCPDMFFLTAREDGTTIITSEAQDLGEDPTMSEGGVTNITSSSGPKTVTNKTNPLFRPEEPKVLEGKTLTSHNAPNEITSFGEVSGHSENCSPTEIFSLHRFHGDMTEHLEESSTPSLGTVSALEESPSSPESSNAASIFVEETHQPFTEDTSILTVTASIPASADLSSTAITTGPSTIPKKARSNESREVTAINDPEHAFTTLDTIVAPTAASDASFLGVKYDITTAITSEDTTVPENTATDFEGDCTDIKEPDTDSTTGDIHMATVTTSTEVGMASVCEAECTPVVNLDRRHSFDTATSKAVDHPVSPTSAPAGIISVSESTNASGGTIATTSVFEETGTENNTSTTGAAIMLTESPEMKVDSMTEINFVCLEVANTSEPISVERDLQILPLAVFTSSNETNMPHRETTSLESPELSMIIGSSVDSIHKASTDPREIVPVLPSMQTDLCSEGTTKDLSNARTIFGDTEAHASQITAPLRMPHIPRTITAVKDANTRITSLSAPQTSPGLEDYPTLEATDVYEESTSFRMVSIPGEDFADKVTPGFKQRPESKSATNSLLDPTSEITTFSTYDTVFSSEDMDSSESASFNKMGTCESIAAKTTVSSNILSPVEVAVSASKSLMSPDESLVSVKFTNTHQTFSPKVITAHGDAPILKESTPNSSEDPNSTEDLTNTSENTGPTELEDSSDISGTPQNPISILFDESNDSPLQEPYITMEEGLIINGETLSTETLSETLSTEAKGHISVPEEASISLPGDISTTTSTPNINSEASMTPGQNIATFSEEHSTAPGSVFSAALQGTESATSGVSIDSTLGARSTASCSTLASGEISADITPREAIDTISDDHKHVLAESPNEIIRPEIPNDTCETSSVVHRKTPTTISKKTSIPTTTTSDMQDLVGLTEIPTTVSDEAVSESREPYLATLGGDVSVAATYEESPLAVIKRSFSASPGKSSPVKPALVQPCWSVMLLTILVTTMVLAMGLIMVIYYTILFFVVTYSAS